MSKCILCAGILVLDEVFRVNAIPQRDTKVEAEGFFIVSGGCAANAAVAIARLGGRAMLASPLGGPAGTDDNGDRVLAALARENVDTGGSTGYRPGFRRYLSMHAGTARS